MRVEVQTAEKFLVINDFPQSLSWLWSLFKVSFRILFRKWSMQTLQKAPLMLSAHMMHNTNEHLLKWECHNNTMQQLVILKTKTIYVSKEKQLKNIINGTLQIALFQLLAIKTLLSLLLIYGNKWLKNASWCFLFFTGYFEVLYWSKNFCSPHIFYFEFSLCHSNILCAYLSYT